MQLGDIASVRAGIVLSRKKVEVDYEKKATYKLLSLKNITEDGFFKKESFEEFNSNNQLDNQYFTSEGDVIMRLSHPHTALYIDQDTCGLLIPSSFAIIKVDESKFSPEYIAWFLNTSEVKKELERSQAGSRIPSTNQNVLKSIPVTWITLSKQKVIVEVYRLHQKEKQLHMLLIEEKEKWFKGLTHKIISD